MILVPRDMIRRNESRHGMGKIIYLMGKSASGKDTIYKELIDRQELQLQTFPIYTTRPIRDGEHDGVEYFFTDHQGYQDLKDQGKVVEERIYHTMQGDWIYFTVLDGIADLEHQNYLMIGTLESYCKIRDKIGKEKLLPIYITLEDGERLFRALSRERAQENPQYPELCRRFLADNEDFSEEHIRKAGIGDAETFDNIDLQKCLLQIMKYLKQNL